MTDRDHDDDLRPILSNDHLTEFLRRYMSLQLGRPKLGVLDLHDGRDTIPVWVIPELNERSHIVCDLLEIDNNTLGAETYKRIADRSEERLSVSLQTSENRTMRVYVTSHVFPLSHSLSFGNGNERVKTFFQGKLAIDGYELGTRGEEIDFAHFCVYDFPDFHNFQMREHVTIIDQDHFLGKMVFASSEHKVSLVQIPVVKPDGPTHAGVLRRIDRQPFSVGELESVIGNLASMLTLSTGTPRWPALVMASDKKGRSIWGRMGDLDPPPHNSNNWFLKMEGDKTQRIFGELVSINRERSNHMSKVIDYYSASEMAKYQYMETVQNALLVSYAGLEALAQLILSREKRPGEKDKEYINEALADANLNIGNSRRKSDVWRIADLRNKFGHANLKELDKLTLNDYWRTWNKAQRYIELSVLKLCNYEGRHYNRVESRIEDLPWK